MILLKGQSIELDLCDLPLNLFQYQDQYKC